MCIRGSLWVRRPRSQGCGGLGPVRHARVQDTRSPSPPGSPSSRLPQIQPGRQSMLDYQREFLDSARAAGALEFGAFRLKSGRESPYFFNAGLFNSGGRLARLGRFYADAIVASGVSFDLLYGPAYKGIPLAAATGIALADHHDRDVPYAFNQGDEGPWRRRRDRGQPPRGGCVDHRRRHLRRDLGAGIRRHHPGPWRPAGGRRHRPRPTRAGSGWALGRRRDHGNLRHAGIQHRHPRRPDRVPGDGSRRRRSAPGHQGLPGPLWRVGHRLSPHTTGKPLSGSAGLGSIK